jgi:hypothetical protein
MPEIGDAALATELAQTIMQLEVRLDDVARRHLGDAS